MYFAGGKVILPSIRKDGPHEYILKIKGNLKRRSQMRQTDKWILLAAVVLSFGTACSDQEPARTNAANPSTLPASSYSRGDIATGKTANRDVYPLSKVEIAKAQRALTDLGYAVPVTGLEGTDTTRAVQKFQAEKALPQTGALDRTTLKALKVISDDADRLPASVE
jgi:hypothetical protein